MTDVWKSQWNSDMPIYDFSGLFTAQSPQYKDLRSFSSSGWYIRLFNVSLIHRPSIRHDTLPLCIHLFISFIIWELKVTLNALFCLINSPWRDSVSVSDIKINKYKSLHWRSWNERMLCLKNIIYHQNSCWLIFWSLLHLPKLIYIELKFILSSENW